MNNMKSLTVALAATFFAMPAVAQDYRQDRDDQRQRSDQRAERGGENQRDQQSRGFEQQVRDTLRGQISEQQVSRLIDDWPNASRKAAEQMIDSYGAPDGVTQTMLVWNDNGPWNSTIVHRDPVQHNFPMPHKDVLAQSVYYDVQPRMVDELVQFDGSVIVDRTKGTITARCDNEAANFLALNLAQDILDDRRSVDEARRYYAEAISDWKQDGEMDPYLRSLQFDPMTAANAGDPDQRADQIAMGDED